MKKNQANLEIRKIAFMEIEKHKKQLRKECMTELLNVTMPVLTLAIKDELKITNKQVEDISKRFERYIGYIGDKTVDISEVERMLGGGTLDNARNKA